MSKHFDVCFDSRSLGFSKLALGCSVLTTEGTTFAESYKAGIAMKGKNRCKQVLY